MKRFLAALAVSTAVLASLPVPLVAQARPPQPSAPPAAPGYVSTIQNAEELREQFRTVLSRYPRNVGRVLRLDPPQFQDTAYNANYPANHKFVTQYPEVARSPEYYLSEYAVNYSEPYTRDSRQQAMDMMRNWVEAIMVFVIVAAISVAV